MIINIEEQSGFCYGVRRAIELAELSVKRGKTVYCLGEIVHNEKEVKRLKKSGMVTIDHEELSLLKNETVLIRAHGEPPATFLIAENNNLTLLDGTCPIVTALQRKIKQRYFSMDPLKDQILIYGKKDHPEVAGLNGQIENNGKVVENLSDLPDLENKRNVYLFSQTTMDTDGFESIARHLGGMKSSASEGKVEARNTICKHISHREPGLRSFAGEHDTLIFIAGKNSSNGRILFEICKSENKNTFFISESEELDPLWFKTSQKVGVCGATSTPAWQLKEVAAKINSFTRN